MNYLFILCPSHNNPFHFSGLCAPLCSLSFNDIKCYRSFSFGLLSFKVDNQYYTHFLNVRFLSPETQLEACSHQCDKSYAHVSFHCEGLKTYVKSLPGCRLISLLFFGGFGLFVCFHWGSITTCREEPVLSIYPETVLHDNPAGAD